jgi:hypothetical protein
MRGLEQDLGQSGDWGLYPAVGMLRRPVKRRANKAEGTACAINDARDAVAFNQFKDKYICYFTP